VAAHAAPLPPPSHARPPFFLCCSGEKAALSRGQTPKSVEESEEKKAGAEKYLAEHKAGEHKSHHK
jgi:hypothetical protein